MTLQHVLALSFDSWQGWTVIVVTIVDLLIAIVALFLARRARKVQRRDSEEHRELVRRLEARIVELE